MPARVRSRIPQIMAQLEPETIEGVKESAEAIVRGAKERVPKDSGDLHDAIHVTVDGQEVRVVAGDDDAFYGHMVEFGTTRMSARPFLIPAYEAERQSLEERVGEKLRDL